MWTVIQDTGVQRGGTAGIVMKAHGVPLKLLLAPTVLPENMLRAKQPHNAPLVPPDTPSLTQAVLRVVISVHRVRTRGLERMVAVNANQANIIPCLPVLHVLSVI